MNFNGQFKQIGTVNTEELETLIKTIPESQWQEHNSRQETFEVHSDTETIPLIFDADFRHRFPTKQPQFEQFKQKIDPVIQYIINFYKQQTITVKTLRPNPVEKGYFVRLILVRLAPNSVISGHRDQGFSLSRAHRIHLPIITNEHVEFTIDGSTKVLKAGEVWEINNRGVHSVKNSSDEARIHFIFDFVIPNEVIEDFNSGTLIA